MREGFAGRVDLLAQPADQDVDRVAHRLLALPPGLLEDLLAGEDPTRPPHEALEDRELARRQGERLSVAGRRAPRRVEAKVAADELGGGPVRVAAQERARARGEHLEIERLAEVVVGALRQPFDGGLRVVSRGEHQDRTRKPVPPGVAADGETVTVGKPPIENEQVVFVKRQKLVRLLDVRRLVAGEARPRERADDEGAQPHVILENEGPHHKSGRV